MVARMVSQGCSDNLMSRFKTRVATLADAPAIAEIYNQGIADRVATFETEPRAASQISEWFRPGVLILVGEAGPDIVLSPHPSPTAHDPVMRVLENTWFMWPESIAERAQEVRCFLP